MSHDSMIAVIAPEPVTWLGPVLEQAGSAGRVVVFAPWAVAAGWAPLARLLPARLRGFARRRVIQGADVRTVPGWIAAEAGVRSWANAHADRTLRARFMLRRVVDAMAARWIKALGPALRVVVAPTCAAEKTLAMAAQLGIDGILLEDICGIRELHCDLDAAWRAHPRCRFLGRYRAPAEVMVRQEVERVLAGYVLVRGRHARELRQAAGMAVQRIVDIGGMDEEAPVTRQPGSGSGRILLAGLAAARHGTMEALAAIAKRPDITLLVRAGEGMEPADLLAHARVRQATTSEREHLAGVDAVIAPCWTEAYLREVTRAGAAGVPVIATSRAAGFVTPAHVIEPGDAEGLGRALDQVLAAGPNIQPQPPQPGPAMASLGGLLRALLDSEHSSS